MGKTLLELFENKDSFKYGTVYSEVKEDKETLVEQETSGIRVKSAVEVNNPGIYGNEATRIVTRSTPDLEKMKQGTGGTEGDGGLIGKGLSKLGVDGGIGGLRDKVNTTLGIPVNQIPSRVIEDIKDQDSQTPVVPGQNGTEVGKLLKESGGNPKTIVKQAGGKLIGKAKDKLRGALFGSPQGLGDANSTRGLINKEEEPMVRFTTNEQGLTYSEQKNSLLGKIEPDNLKGTKLDLSKVSPIYGVRRSTTPKYGESIKASEGVSSLYSPEVAGLSYNGQSRTTPLFSKFGLGPGDSINLLSPSDDYTLDDNQSFAKVGDKVLYDFIPVWMKKIGSTKPVMFRALISGLNETVSPSWNTSKFVGNPYNFYTFDSIERSTSFNLKMYCNNSVELANNWEKITKITQMTYPSISAQYANAPIIQFRIGDIYKNKTGFIESLTYNIPDDSNWETDGDSGYLPKIVDVAITIKFIESVGAEDRPYGYTISKAAAEAINEKRQANADIQSSRTESDGSINQDKPIKVTAKGNSPFETAKPTAPKIPTNFTTGKKSSTPADAESAKLADGANQGGTVDKLDGKTPLEKTKEIQNKENLTSTQSVSVMSLTAEGFSKNNDKGAKEHFSKQTDKQFVLYKKDLGPFKKYTVVFTDGTTNTLTTLGDLN